MADAVRAHLRSLDADPLHVPADYFIDKVTRYRAFVAVKYMIVRACCCKLEKEISGLVTDGNLTPACLAVDDDGFLLDVVLQEGAHLTGPHPVVLIRVSIALLRGDSADWSSLISSLDSRVGMSAFGRRGVLMASIWLGILWRPAMNLKNVFRAR
jgi:hypothetical protein